VIEAPYAHGDFGDSDFASDALDRQSLHRLRVPPAPERPPARGGLRVPLMEAEIIPFTSLLTDVDRQEAFVPYQVTMRLGLHYHTPRAQESHVSYDLRFVPTGWVVTTDARTSFLEDANRFFGYGGIVRYEGDAVRVGGGLAGRWNATSDGADFGEASFHQFDLAADFLKGSVRPGVQLKLRSTTT
jgi:hypothetical protein